MNVHITVFVIRCDVFPFSQNSRHGYSLFQGTQTLFSLFQHMAFQRYLPASPKVFKLNQRILFCHVYRALFGILMAGFARGGSSHAKSR